MIGWIALVLVVFVAGWVVYRESVEPKHDASVEAALEAVGRKAGIDVASLKAKWRKHEKAKQKGWIRMREEGK